MSFTIALSGISAATTDLNTISNNIANANSTGFKESRAEFGDFFQNAAYNLQTSTTGGGVRTQTIAQQFAQGSITNTSNPLDLAISGEGFFSVKDNGSVVYTRNGAFTTDSSGFVVTASGQRLQVYPPLAGGTTFSTGTLSDLQLSTAPNPPAATTSIGAGINLPANATAPSNATFSPTDTSSYNQTTAVTIYDSLGAAHTASLYFVAGASAGSWTLHTVVDGSEVGTGTALTFDSSGKATAPAGGLVPLAFTPADGAAAISANIDLGKATQYGGSFAVNSLTQNGYATGQLSGVAVDGSGVVSARYSNGQTTVLGQVAMANFANPQGLQQLGDATWAQTFASGQAVPGAAGTSDFGAIQSGALESSNVDLTQQLVDMMNAQRNYQANSQVISTDDQLMQTILQLR
ncbi:MAG TPA: flagellar hook protein FlgE [Nevskia sp.]|nr:flagellar hook protein FlgE [Nevskia sp.]